MPRECISYTMADAKSRNDHELLFTLELTFLELVLNCNKLVFRIVIQVHLPCCFMHSNYLLIHHTTHSF